MVPIPAGAPIFEQRLEYSSPEYAAPRYAGNISETSWSRADTARMTYVYAYDRLGRLVDGHCTTGAAPSARHYGERNITYDKNSNILSLDRYNGAIAATRYRYAYDGNRILTVATCRTSPVGQTPVTEYAYRYDLMGNVTFNGAEALQVTYNYRNLPKRATKADMRAATDNASTYVVGVAPHVVQNLYLADGTKVRATDDRGRGYEYLGSLSRTFLSPRHSPNEFGSALGLTKRSLRLNVNGEVADIESIPFAGGRIDKTTNGYEPHYYVTDHLGSTRAIVRPAAAGVEIMAEYDYMPYGTQHIVAEAPTADADYKYTGKEQQGAFGMYSLYDSQARFQNVSDARFLSHDPLSGSFPEFSPYIYCGGDPINRADPTGAKIEDPYNIYSNHRAEICQQINGLEQLSKTLRDSDMLELINRLIYEYRTIINEYDRLDQSDVTYKIGYWDKTGGGTGYENGSIIIKVGRNESQGVIAHELKHAYQYEMGELSFLIDQNGVDFGSLYDITDETAAYNRERIVNAGISYYLTGPDQCGEWNDEHVRQFGRKNNLVYGELGNGPININSKIGQRIRVISSFMSYFDIKPYEVYTRKRAPKDDFLYRISGL